MGIATGARKFTEGVGRVVGDLGPRCPHRWAGSMPWEITACTSEGYRPRRVRVERLRGRPRREGYSKSGRAESWRTSRVSPSCNRAAGRDFRAESWAAGRLATDDHRVRSTYAWVAIRGGGWLSPRARGAARPRARLPSEVAIPEPPRRAVAAAIAGALAELGGRPRVPEVLRDLVPACRVKWRSPSRRAVR